MRPELPARLLGFAKFVTVVVLGLAVGLGGGYGLGQLGGGDPSGADDTSATALTSTSGGTGATTTAALAAARTLQVTVRSVRYRPASTAGGRKRNRARLAVRLSVRNTAEGASTLGSAFIAFAKDRVKRDANATGPAAALAQPIPAGTTVQGELRFETAGATTDRLKRRKTAKLRINGQTLVLSIAR
ncbi:MAG: hypothetical protein JWN65_46 [Solirubrobacterales bacterium]|nr:hypothetical protein [Solirubrobacterales bacterium]